MKKLTKPVILAQNSSQGSFVATCPSSGSSGCSDASQSGWGPTCKKCERTA